MSWFTTLKNTALWFVVEWQLFLSMGWHNAGSRSCVQLCGGDFNGHVARGDGPSPHCGLHGIAEPATATGGKFFLEWIVSTSLTVADIMSHVAARGTWLHTAAKVWYEIDWLLIDQSRAHQVQQRIRSVPGVAESTRRERLVQSCGETSFARVL